MTNGGSAAETPSVEESSWTDHLVAIAVAAVAGAAIAATALFLAGYFDTGDEPPIRVKNGSMELQLLSNNRQWKDEGGPKRWRISGGTRGADDLDVDIAVNAGAACTTQSKSGNDLVLLYSNGTRITISSQGRHIRVVSTEDLTLGSGGRLLTYTGAGYISSVTLGGSTMCTFTDKAQLASLVIMDY